MHWVAEASTSLKKNNDLNEVKIVYDAQRLLGTGEHVDEEHDVAVEEEGLDEARLVEDGIVEDVELVPHRQDGGLLRSKLFLEPLKKFN